MKQRTSVATVLVNVVVALFLLLFLAVPLLAIILGALSRGLALYVDSVRAPEALAAMRLTLVTSGLAVGLNTTFGVLAAWAITRGSFRGKSLLVTLIDLPLSVSPVVSGLVFVLLFGARGVFGPWLLAHGVKIIFTPAALVLATTFVTFPLVARELIGLMEAQGTDEELAAVTLGAGSWATFVHVTLPKIRWGLLYGVLLCNARAMGEFGAVSVVSGHIRGHTNTVPLHVENLYNEYNFAGAFAVASLLLLVSVLTLVAKSLVEGRVEAKARR